MSERHVVDCSTGQESRVPYTEKELAQRKTDEKEMAARRALIDAEETQLEADKQAIRDGTADQATRDRLLLLLLS